MQKMIPKEFHPINLEILLYIFSTTSSPQQACLILWMPSLNLSLLNCGYVLFYWSGVDLDDLLDITRRKFNEYNERSAQKNTTISQNTTGNYKKIKNHKKTH